VRVGCEQLNANVVRSGRLVFADAIADRIEITPRDDRVDQPVAASVPEIVFAESEP
jgi:hypothetical protein